MLFNKTWCDAANTHMSSHCFDAPASTSFVNRNTRGSFVLHIDGELVETLSNWNGADLVKLQGRVAGTHVSESAQTTLDVVVGAEFLGRTHGPIYGLHTFAYSDGLIGGSTPSSMLMLMMQISDDEVDSTRPTMALDFGATEHSSRIDIGGIQEQYRERLVWAPSAAFSDSLPFVMHDLSVCGVNLLENATSGWPTLLDTGAACLSLPAALYDQVMSWIPHVCVLTPLATDPAGESCFLPDGFTPKLPTLSFTVQKGSARRVFVRLEDLLLPASTSFSGRRYCIHRVSPVTRQWVSFGTYVLRSLYTVVNYQTQQLAFAQKDATLTEASTVQCKARVTCRGMQTHSPSLNLCKDPTCSSFYFFELNHATKECELSQSFYIVVIVFIFVYIFCELGLNEVRERLCAKVLANVQAR
jgi:hypothetical protein